MAKDDYFVLVYRILTRLYAYFKAGEKPDITTFNADILGINYGYFINIMESLYNEGYIKGISIFPAINGQCDIKVIDLKITQSGIEYLQENTMMKKAHNFIKGVTEIIPGF